MGRLFAFMPYDYNTNSWTLTPLLDKLQREKKSGIELQKKRHEDWTDNYELDRNKVRTNRLTQRQAVNVPLMKETRKTLLSKIDDPPNVEWSENAGDQQKELYYQEVWGQHLKDNNLELIDVLDKNNVLMYGSSTKILNLGENGIDCEVADAYDIVFDPLMVPWDLESARFIVRQNIFKSVREILADPKYSSDGKKELKVWADSPAGMEHSGKTKEQWEAKMERLKAMDIDHGDFPYYAAADKLVNLTEHFTKVWDNKQKKFVKRVIVYADDKIELYNETLMDCLGVDFWPFVRWAEDPQILDIYPDAVADTVRTANMILNVWVSQILENRTLKNFQMHWFLPVGGYTAQTYVPGQGAMLPAPVGADNDINKVIKPVEISGLDDSLDIMNWVIQMVERATGATAIEKGEGQQGEQTLGEIQILVGKAMERTTAMAKFYRLAWYEYAVKWTALMHANGPKFIKLYKKGRDGKVYPKAIFTGDWKSEAGYEPAVSSTSEQEQSDLKSIQKFMFVLSQFPNNLALRKIAQKRELELLDLTPEELKEVQEAEEQAMLMAQNQGPAPGMPAQNPMQNAIQQVINQPANA